MTSEHEKAILIYTPDRQMADQLSEKLDFYAISDACLFLSDLKNLPRPNKSLRLCLVILQPGNNKGSVTGSEFIALEPVPIKYLEAPVRIGMICDEVQHALKKHAAAQDPVILGSYLYRMGDDFLTHKERLESVPLTEKEKYLLQVLLEAGGDSLSREALLKKVWAYQADIQTHTLETHVYRLRQKIEADPGNPAVLITEMDGYRLIAE